MTSTQILFFLAVYLLGSIPFGLIIARISTGVDVRRTGSGNIGATNVLRTTSKGLGVLTLLADITKAAMPAWLAQAIWPQQPEIAALTGLFSVIGHCFSVFLKFKGGKGVAVALGVFLVLAPKALMVGLIVFLTFTALTRMVSVGSLTCVISSVGVMAWQGTELMVLLPVLTMAVIIFARHRSNLVRMVQGTENRLGDKQS